MTINARILALSFVLSPVRMSALSLALSLSLLFPLAGMGTAVAGGPVLCIDLQTTPEADPSTIAPTYAGADSVLYAFLVVTESPGDLVSGISLGFELEDADSVTNEGFTFLADWQVSGNGYGFYPPPSNTPLHCPAAVGYWTLHLHNGANSTAALRLLPPGDVNGDAVLVLDSQHRALAVEEIHHGGVNRPAPDPIQRESLCDELLQPAFHVLAMYRGSAVALPPGITGAPLDAITEIDPVLSTALTRFAPLRLDTVSPFVGPADSVAYTNDGYPIRLPPIWKTVSLTASRVTAVDSLVAALRAIPTITYAERDTRAEPALNPNDPLYVNGSQTNLNSPTDQDIDAPEAWDITTGSPTVRVSVVDTGIYRTHPDLQSRLFLGDSGARCYFADGYQYHGTEVTAVLAASTNNAIGMAGVNWGSAILNECVDFSNQQVATAIDTSVIAHAAAVNFSGIWTNPDTLETTRRSAMRAMMSGTAVIAAAGNSAVFHAGYPAAFDPICIAVGMGSAAATHGPWLDVVAPPLVWSVAGVQGYHQVLGSSFSCPQVTGIVSLLASFRSGLSDRDFEEIIERTAVDLGEAGFDTINGWGRANAAAALQYVRDRTVIPGTTVPPALIHAGAPSNWFTVYWRFPPNEYPTHHYIVRTYELLATNVPLPSGFSGPPDIWLRLGGTVGLENPPGLARQYDYPWGEAFNVTANSASFRTYVYEVHDSLDAPLGWWPARPDEGRFCYTVAGFPASGAGVQGDPETRVEPLTARVAIGRSGALGWSAAIQLTSPVNGAATIDVFDASGRLVRGWRDVRVDGGAAEVVWDGRNGRGDRAATGVYFVRVAVAGAGRATTKFVRIVP